MIVKANRLKKLSNNYSISVIIMTFNEPETLEQVVTDIDSQLKTLFSGKYEILIVDDGSTDGTEEIADNLQIKFPSVFTIHHKKNEGLGKVYRTGFSKAKMDFITFFPADAQLPASNIFIFAKWMENFDLILGYLPPSNRSILGKFLSKAERLLYHLAFGEFPKFQGTFLVRKNLLREIKLVSRGRGWAIVMELIIRASRGPYRITSIPIEASPRVSGRSKVNNFRTILSSLRQLIYLYKNI